MREHVADLGGRQARQLVKRHLFAELAEHAVEKHHVKMRVTLHVTRRALHDDDRATLARHTLRVERER